MTIQEKLAMLEEIMELDEGLLVESNKLSDYEEWDSVATLAFIVLLHDQFGKDITSKDIEQMVTVRDAISMMEN